MSRFFILVLFFCFYQLLNAQERVMDGYLEEMHSGKSILGVVVKNKHLKIETQSSIDGKFSIRYRIGDELSFSKNGYQTVSIIAKSSSMKIRLKKVVTDIETVVIKAKSNINDIDIRKAVGAITQIDMKELRSRPEISIISALQGQSSGLYIKNDGELGKPPKVRIRGSSTLAIKKVQKLDESTGLVLDNRANQPLYILDGQIITPDIFVALNLNDIEEIKVLKDAAANALYGIKAANGVIEISSKKGINGATRYSVSYQNGITFKGSPKIHMMETEEKLAFERITKNLLTPGYFYSEEYYRKYYPNAPHLETLIAEGTKKLDSISKINTNWFKELARANTFQDYNISVRGGNAKSRYYVSGGYIQQGGKFEGNDLQRITGKLNYDFNIGKGIKVMFNSGIGITKNNTPNSSDYQLSDLIYRLNPYEQKNTGTLISYNGRQYSDLVDQYSQNKTSSQFNFSSNLFGKIASYLDFSSVVGLNYSIDEHLSLVPRTAYSEAKSGVPENERGKAEKSKITEKNISVNTRLNYHQTFGRHQLSASANADYYTSDRDLIGIVGYGLPSKLKSAAGIDNDIKGTRHSVTSSATFSEAQLGFGASMLYTWDEKIEVYGSYKVDGSSLMPKDKRWNSFWATGLGYTLSNEVFLKKSKVINLFKLRASYGVTASLAGVEASLVVPQFSYGSNSYLGNRYFALKNLYNEFLKPEKNTSYNIGIDASFFNKINFSLDYYKRTTDEMLLTMPIAPSNGFTQQMQNVGAMQNTGLELTLSGKIWNQAQFSWNTSVNISYNQNKVLDLYDGEELYLTNDKYPDYKEGYPSDIIYGLIDLGIHPVDGTPRYQRADGRILNGQTEVPDKGDFVILGHKTPPITGGWYHQFQYKNWQLGIDFYFSFGSKAIFENRNMYYEDTDTYTNFPAGQLNSTWFEIGDEGKIHPSPFLGTGNIYQNIKYATDRNIGNNDFIRLNNLRLSYSFEKEQLSRWTNIKIKSLVLNLQLKNIWTITAFQGVDPESASLSGSVQPIMTMGINFSF